MGMNQTPSADRVHIGFFGRRNAGKSSVVNAVTGQSLAVVSDVKGTTTDPVQKAMELLPVGPVVIIDTPGIDDEGHLGELRVRKTKQVLNKTDVAVLVVDGTVGKQQQDEELIALFKEKNIPYLVAYNKLDLLETAPETASTSVSRAETAPETASTSVSRAETAPETAQPSGKTAMGKPNHTSAEIYVSAEKHLHINELKDLIASLAVTEEPKQRIVADLIKPLDFVVLVVPIDKAAPKGRLILPQQQTIRDIMDTGAVSIVVRNTELRETLETLGKKPALVITDSQAFAEVSGIVPKDILLTSFSILFARYKGSLDTTVNGAAALKNLKDGDKVLISEGCTHHRQCGDIGSVKLPAWIREYTGKHIEFEFTSGTEFPDDLTAYGLIVHCGGCMLNEREMKYRLKCAEDQGVPMTNYGILIAEIKGILSRSLEVFKS